MELLIQTKLVREGARLPSFQTSGAAGADIYACIPEPIQIGAAETVCIPSGVAVEIPEGYAGFIFGRSGVAVREGLAPANKVGLIDSDYRGELMICLHNHSRMQYTVKPGERVAQLVIVPVAAARYVQCASLSETERGENGFGSTGRS